MQLMITAYLDYEEYRTTQYIFPQDLVLTRQLQFIFPRAFIHRGCMRSILEYDERLKLHSCLALESLPEFRHSFFIQS